MAGNFLIGIDGGGSKTEIVVCSLQGKVLSRETIGPTNPNDIGTQEAVCRLKEGILNAKKTVNDADAEFFVFAGVSGALNRKAELSEALSRLFPHDRVSVDSDAVNLLSSEVPVGDGCCLICGTGSVCFVRRDSQYTRIGGWGYLLDRCGSGFAVGREALEAVLRAHDGRGDATLLNGAVREKIGKPAWEAISEIYDGGKPYIASFAPLVFDCEKSGDRISFEILSRQAGYLSECLDTAYEMGADGAPSYTAVLGGGLFREPSVLTACMERALTTPVKLLIAQMPPVFGALCQARIMARGEAEMVESRDEFCRTFLASYHPGK